MNGTAEYSVFPEKNCLNNKREKGNNMQKKKEITDLIPEQDKDKETNTAKASVGKTKAQRAPSQMKLKNFSNGKLND